MKKAKTVYVCTECDYQSAKWMGRCPQCGNWNTFKEETYEAPAPAAATPSARRHTMLARVTGENEPELLTSEELPEYLRRSTGIGDYMVLKCRSSVSDRIIQKLRAILRISPEESCRLTDRIFYALAVLFYGDLEACVLRRLVTGNKVPHHDLIILTKRSGLEIDMSCVEHSQR